MARQWVIKRGFPTWVKIVFYSVIGYAAIVGVMVASAIPHGR